MLNCHVDGPFTHEQLSELYGTVDFMIFPTTLKESLGLVGVEALTCGCPVIGSNIGCLPEYIKNGYNGYLFECGNPEDLAAKIETYYHLDIDFQKLLRLNAYKSSRRYDSVIVAGKMIEVLKDVSNINNL